MADVKLLNTSDPNFVDNLREALGVEPGEAVEFITPQFQRTDGRKIGWHPATLAQWENLRNLHPHTLTEMGLCRWSGEDGAIHWLYPAEWFAHIPDGLPTTCIDGVTEPWDRPNRDDDIRFGCLAYGFVQRDPKAEGQS